MIYPDSIHKQVGFVYVLKDWNLADTYKIVITIKKIQQRLKEINQCPGPAVKLEYLSPATEGGGSCRSLTE